jgi:alpha-N-arabinofuranosidase
MQVVGEEQLLVNGGVDISQEPVWIEAPHIYHIGEYYYLMCAEGGTGYNHSEVVFRSDSVFGPYEPYAGNPILTQRHLDPARPHPITTTGHADLVETPAGEWYAVFLGCRPYEGGHFNTGRETFLTPVSWEDGWPMIVPGREEVHYTYPLPAGVPAAAADEQLEGRYADRDDFTGSPDPRWLQLRTPKEEWYAFDPEAGQLTMNLRPQAIDRRGNPSALFKRQPHLFGSVTTRITFTPQQPEEMAGLIVLQNDDHYYFLNKAAEEIQLLKQTEAGYQTLATVPYKDASVHLRIVARGAAYDFAFSADGENFTPLAENVDARYLSTETAGGFVGCMYGLYACSNGQETNNTAVFDYLDILTEDDPF